MKRSAWLVLLALSACNEYVSHLPPPMDRFFFPDGLALTPTASGNQALLVVSANFDLHYDKQRGATLLSVDPGLYDSLSGTGGSAGRPGGALVKLGPGAQLGAYAGPVDVVEDRTCPDLAANPRILGPTAFVAARYTSLLYGFPLGPDGSVAPCQGPGCELALDPDLADPAAIAMACRSDGARRSLFVGYLRSPVLRGYPAMTGWLTEFDLDSMGASRTYPLGPGPVGDMTYDAATDRLYAVGRYAGPTAPLFILDLPNCRFDDADPVKAAGCIIPPVQTVDLIASVRGAELVSIALSNPQPGRPRLAYIAARIYDEDYAAATFYRPPFDLGGALLVVELDENLAGAPLARVRDVIPIGLGAGEVGVLPVRPGLGDLMVVPASGDGSIYVYDDEARAVVRVVTLDQTTGAPEAGHTPYSLVVQDQGAEALVYLAAFADGTISMLRVPMADPSSADLVRYGAAAGTQLAGQPVRIGGAL